MEAAAVAAWIFVAWIFVAWNRTVESAPVFVAWNRCRLVPWSRTVDPHLSLYRGTVFVPWNRLRSVEAVPLPWNPLRSVEPSPWRGTVSAAWKQHLCRGIVAWNRLRSVESSSWCGIVRLRSVEPSP